MRPKFHPLQVTLRNLRLNSLITNLRRLMKNEGPQWTNATFLQNLTTWLAVYPISCRRPVSSELSRGPHRELYIPGGPHTMISTSSDGEAECFSMTCLSIWPLVPSHGSSFPARETTCATCRRSGSMLIHVSSKSLQRMSSSVLLQ